jgi:DNA-binding CsgD family transcriptional regulator
MTTRGVKAILQLIDLLYSCASGESSWSKFLDATTEHFGATATGLFTTGSLQEAVGVDPEEMRKYQDYYMRISPCFGIPYPEGVVLMTEEIVALDVYRKSAFYNEWAKKNLLAHSIGGDVRVRHDLMLSLSINRGDFENPFSEQHREVAQLLMPHLRRAANLHSRMIGLEERAWVLDGLAFPMMYVSADGAVHWANVVAENVLRSGRGLRLRDGRIHAQLASDDARLHKMLSEERVIAERIDGYGGWLRITSPDDGSERSLFLTRPPRRIRRSIGVPETSSGYLIFVATQAIDTNTLTRRLRATWGLTVAEAVLAVEVLEGEGLQSAAAKLRISRNTAKTQLSSVFQKAGVRRQSELVRKLLALAVIGISPIDKGSLDV